MKATPRPWQNKGLAIKDLQENWIADLHSMANAELIVRAVNCHDELVEALESLISKTTDYRSMVTDENIDHLKPHVEYIDKLTKIDLEDLCVFI